MNLKHASMIASAAAATLLLTACGSNGDTDSTATPESTATETAEPSPTDDQSEGDTQAGLPPRPAQDECVRIEVPSGGRYTVYDAGQAVVQQDGQRLVLGEVEPADGWTSSVDSRDRDEVEIEFRSDSGEDLDLEVELDDGRLQAEICQDDD